MLLANNFVHLSYSLVKLWMLAQNHIICDNCLGAIIINFDEVHDKLCWSIFLYTWFSGHYLLTETDARYVLDILSSFDLIILSSSHSFWLLDWCLTALGLWHCYYSLTSFRFPCALVLAWEVLIKFKSRFTLSYNDLKIPLFSFYKWLFSMLRLQVIAS